jgi:hypothetical protein
MKVEMTSADFRMNGHCVNIMKSGYPRGEKWWILYYHHNSDCKNLGRWPTQKAAVKEARRYLREVNHV